jgi:hypothetical protein
MPFKSIAQERWMFANHPEMAKQWAADTPDQSALPSRVGDKMQKKSKADPRMDALNELHSMLSGAISAKLKAKKHPAPETDPEDADDPANENSTPDSAQEEAAEAKAADKNKKRFGPGHKK